LAALSVSARAQDYVIVCDTYGTGFFYIPGTETCLNAERGETRTETSEGTVVGETKLASRVSDIEARIDGAFSDSFKDIAIASALADPDLVAGEHFGVRVNWGNAGSKNAFGFSGAVVLGENVFGDRGRITGTGAIAFTDGRVGGRAGLQLTW
jgi:hypothetical protein